MKDSLSSAPQMPRDPMPLPHGRRAVTALAAVFVACGVFVAVNACDHASAGSNQAARANADTVADRQPGAVPSVAPAPNVQASQYVSVVDAGKVVITGTSTLHDWTINGGAIKGNAEFSGQLKADVAPAITLQSVDLSIPVDSLKSTEGGGMNDKVYEALKLKEFPAITYRLTKATLKAAPSKEGSPYHFDTAGQLTVAGGTHPVNLDLAIVSHDGGKLTISTEVGLQMTDFGVKPPTAMFGAIKSGNKVAVKVTWQLSTATPAGSPGK